MCADGWEGGLLERDELLRADEDFESVLNDELG